MTWPQSGAAGIHYQCMVVIMSCTSSALLQCEANQVVTSPVTSSQLAAALESLKSQLFSLSSGTRNYAHGYYSFHHSSVGHILKKLRTPKILRKMALYPHLLVYFFLYHLKNVIVTSLYFRQTALKIRCKMVLIKKLTCDPEMLRENEERK